MTTESNSSTEIKAQPGTKTYAGMRSDARAKLLKAAVAAVKKAKKSRGEPSLLVKAATYIDGLIESYDLDPEMTDTDIVNESEVYFGSIVSRLHRLAEESAKATT